VKREKGRDKQAENRTKTKTELKNKLRKIFKFNRYFSEKYDLPFLRTK
jgi:hypothetical protein